MNHRIAPRTHVGAWDEDTRTQPPALDHMRRVAVAITALVLNFRFFNSLERRIEVIGRDLKDFFRTTAEHDKRLSKLEDK